MTTTGSNPMPLDHDHDHDRRTREYAVAVVRLTEQARALAKHLTCKGIYGPLVVLGLPGDITSLTVASSANNGAPTHPYRVLMTIPETTPYAAYGMAIRDGLRNAPLWPAAPLSISQTLHLNRKPDQ